MLFRSAILPTSSRLAMLPMSSRLTMLPTSSRLAMLSMSSRLTMLPTSSRLAMLPTSPTCSFVVLVVVDEARLLSSHHRWHRLETVGEAAVLGVHFSVILAYLHEWCLRAEQWLNNLNSWTHINQTMVTLWENSTDRLCTTATEATNANFGEDTNCLSLV